jgi:Ca2+-binding EF-hand superfamily protein
MQRFEPAFDEIKETFERLDENGNGSIEFEEFTALMLEMDHSRAEGALRLQFTAIDTNRDGRISFDELRVWLGAGR